MVSGATLDWRINQALVCIFLQRRYKKEMKTSLNGKMGTENRFHSVSGTFFWFCRPSTSIEIDPFISLLSFHHFISFHWWSFHVWSLANQSVLDFFFSFSPYNPVSPVDHSLQNCHISQNQSRSWEGTALLVKAKSVHERKENGTRERRKKVGEEETGHGTSTEGSGRVEYGVWKKLGM